MSATVSPRQVAESLAEYWSPRIIAELDDSFVKVAKVNGVFGWHSHADEDELFRVLLGVLHIALEHGSSVELAVGDRYVVPQRCASQCQRGRRLPAHAHRAQVDPALGR